MAAIPFLLIGLWIATYFDEKEKARKRELNEIVKWRERGEKRFNSKPRYRMKEVNPEDNELFLTDLGDFDEAFKL